jgi:hypothetical protein
LLGSSRGRNSVALDLAAHKQPTMAHLAALAGVSVATFRERRRAAGLPVRKRTRKVKPVPTSAPTEPAVDVPVNTPAAMLTTAEIAALRVLLRQAAIDGTLFKRPNPVNGNGAHQAPKAKLSAEDLLDQQITAPKFRSSNGAAHSAP